MIFTCESCPSKRNGALVLSSGGGGCCAFSCCISSQSARNSEISRVCDLSRLKSSCKGVQTPSARSLLDLTNECRVTIDTWVVTQSCRPACQNAGEVNLVFKTVRHLVRALNRSALGWSSPAEASFLKSPTSPVTALSKVERFCSLLTTSGKLSTVILGTPVAQLSGGRDLAGACCAAA